MKRYPHTLFFQIIMPFLIFLLIPMLLLNCAIFQLLDGIRAEEYNKHLAKLEISGNYLRNILEESISISRRLSFDNELQQLTYLTNDKAPEDYAKIYTLNRAFQQYVISDGSDYTIYIYCVNNSVFLSGQGICNDLSYFYGKSYQFGDYSLEEFDAMAMNADYRILYYAKEHFMIDSSVCDGLFYITSLNNPVNNQQSKGIILTIIHQEMLNKTLNVLNGSDGFSYITDREGNLLFVSEGVPCEIQDYYPVETKGYLPEEVYGRRYAAAYFCLPEGLNIYSVQPVSTIIQNTRTLTYLVMTLNLTVIFICAAASVFITRKRHRKLRAAFSMLDFPEEGKQLDYFDSINKGIASLLRNNRLLSDKLTHNVFMLRNDFWNRLLYDRFHTLQEMQKFAVHSDLNLDSPYFCLLLFCVQKRGALSQEPEENDWEDETICAYRSRLLESLESGSAHRGYVYQMSMQQVLLFLRISEEEKGGYRQIAEEIADLAPVTSPDIDVHCVGSGLFDSILLAGDAYASCNNILFCYYQTLGSAWRSIVWSDERRQTANLYFPQKLMEQLLSSIRAGEDGKVSDLFLEIFQRNFNETNSLSPYMSSQLMSRIRMLIIETYRDEMGFDLVKQLRQIDRLSSDSVRISHYMKLIKRICDYYRENIGQKTENLRKKIISYIDANYTSPSFSLTEVASHCGFSDSYFSMLFRETMQENFSVYVERLKMNFADRLLRETDLKIDEVAHRTGYYDVNAFRRAYKKYYSVSPSQRRSSS